MIKMDIIDTLNEILKANYRMGSEQWKREGGDLPETQAIEEILRLRNENAQIDRLKAENERLRNKILRTVASFYNENEAAKEDTFFINWIEANPELTLWNNGSYCGVTDDRYDNYSDPKRHYALKCKTIREALRLAIKTQKERATAQGKDSGG